MTSSFERPRDLVNKIFGDDLPRASTDERETDSSAADADHENWLRNNVPPHHGESARYRIPPSLDGDCGIGALAALTAAYHVGASCAGHPRIQQTWATSAL